MSNYPLTEEQVLQFHPKEHAAIVAEIAKKLKKSKAKNKAKDTSEIKWSYSTAVLVHAYSAADFFSGNVKQQSKLSSLQNEIQDEVQRTSVSLCGSLVGGWSREDLNFVPQIIVDDITRRQTERQAEQNRVNSLSEKDRQKEFAETLKELSKYSGFRAFRM